MTASAESITRAAARNNAEWCAAVAGTHGAGGDFLRSAWVAASRTPPYYPDAVTLVPGADPAELLSRIDVSAPGASVKDSFADVDLGAAGFDVLFTAQWILRPGTTTPTVGRDVRWSVVDDVAALRRWAAAWDGGAGHADLFRAELLDDSRIVVIAGDDRHGRLVAGAVANRSVDVVGLSNVFSCDGDLDVAWGTALAAVRALLPGVPVVGYERGAGLEAALVHGFEPLGPLRVWMHGAPLSGD